MSEITEKILLTGSRVYGTPTEKSDVDLVLLVSPALSDQLTFWCDDEETENENSYDNSSVRYGKLNLLMVTKQIDFDVWKLGTELLIEEAPVERDRAVEVFDILRAKAGEKPFYAAVEMAAQDIRASRQSALDPSGSSGSQQTAGASGAAPPAPDDSPSEPEQPLG